MINAQTSLVWGATSAVKARPALALLVAEMIAISADVDAQVGDTFTAMLGAEARPALAMFSALRAANIQRQVMMAAAKEILDARSITALGAVLAFAQSAMADRNKFAHWHWGHSPEHPDALLLLEPDGKRLFDRGFSTLVSRTLDGSIMQPPVMMDELFGPIGSALVYRESDLSASLMRMNSARRAVEIMHTIIAPQSAGQPVDEVWNALLSDPELAEAIVRQQAKDAG